MGLDGLSPRIYIVDSLLGVLHTARDIPGQGHGVGSEGILPLLGAADVGSSRCRTKIDRGDGGSSTGH